MGSGDWFRTIIIRKRVKGDRSKQAKVHSTTERLNGSKGRGKESNALANGASTKNARISRLTEGIAATRIQTAFRAYVARKALNRLRGIVRCRGAIKDLALENHPSSALSHIHFWTKMQAEIKARRLLMVTQSKLQQKKHENRLKLEAKLQELEVEWCGGSETMEEILQRIQQREEAAVKRERAMAYAFSHQWRANSSQYFGHAYYDLGKDSWGWSWKERWVAVRPWETRVQAKAVYSKKIQAKQEDKVGKTTKTAAMKITLTVKPPLSNGKSSTQGRRLPNHTDEKQASR